MKYGPLILRKSFKFVPTRCQILRLKCTKFNFGWGYAQDHTGGAYNTLPAFILLKEERGGVEKEVWEKERRGKGGTQKLVHIPDVRNHEKYRLHNSLIWLVAAEIQTFAPVGKHPRAATASVVSLTVIEDRKSQECSWLLQKIAYLRPIPLSHSIQHCTRLNCAPFSTDFALLTCVRFVTHSEFEFAGLKQVEHDATMSWSDELVAADTAKMLMAGNTEVGMQQSCSPRGTGAPCFEDIGERSAFNTHWMPVSGGHWRPGQHGVTVFNSQQEMWRRHLQV